MENYYTLTPEIKKHKDYVGLQAMLDRLCANPEVIARFPGNCISASDIIQHMLDFYGVKSKLVECQVMLIKSAGEQKDFRFVGFNNVGLDPNTIDTHVVVVTETVPPLMIDASLGHYLPEKEWIMIREMNGKKDDLMGEYVINDISLTYRPKKQIKIPGLHQKNIMDRLEEDAKNRQSIKKLYWFVAALVGMSILNMLFNLTLISLKLIWS
jgi:hypothetical protein